jgi:hypothetical protein
MPDQFIYKSLSSDSFLEYAFLRWVLTPAVKYEAIHDIKPQVKINLTERNYRIDYAIFGNDIKIAIELEMVKF